MRTNKSIGRKKYSVVVFSYCLKISFTKNGMQVFCFISIHFKNMGMPNAVFSYFSCFSWQKKRHSPNFESKLVSGSDCDESVKKSEFIFFSIPVKAGTRKTAFSGYWHSRYYHDASAQPQCVRPVLIKMPGCT